ncbi:lipocalin family protein [Flavobacterium fluviatile]|uniref:lipocalin family protein n=1 Tax=Flavobacterium fluviatile TaxID=1862387 RepID=UPI0013D276C6|nr:lipocalin family protein [Flavobacterium fluviatile]
MSVLTLGLSVASCSSDDDNDGGTSGSIEGKWEPTHYGVIVNGKESLEAVSSGSCSKPILEILSNGTFKDTYSESYGGKCETYTETGTWTKKDNTFTVKYEGETSVDTYEIVELTGSKLKIKQTYTEEGQTYSEVNVFVKK